MPVSLLHQDDISTMKEISRFLYNSRVISDELLSSYNVEKKEIQLLNSRVAEIAIPLFSENVCPGLIINNNPEEHHHNNIYVRSNDQL